MNPLLAIVLIIPWPILAYLGMSVLTFVLYVVDKNKAVKGRWRISENMLHACELLGGWPGGLIAQQVVRHKNRKLSYMVVFWGILVVHVGFWAWWFGLIRG